MARAIAPTLLDRRARRTSSLARFFQRDRVGATASTVAEASQVIKDRAGWPMPTRHAALAIARLETDFGVSGSWLLPGGVPSYNFGALRGTGPAGFITHGDQTAEGAAETVKFQAFHNMSEAFDAFRKVWARGDVSADKSIPHDSSVLDPASRGDALGIARTMYAHRYFTGTKGSDDDRILAYAKAIAASAAEIARQLGEPVSVTLEGSPSTPSSVWRPIAVFGTLAAAAVWWVLR